jgi:outer membrane protein OmpA-like peptidoglycan-associated protein
MTRAACRRAFPCALLCALLWGAPGHAAADSPAPTASQMIEALRGTAPATRSLRNLGVEASAAAPSGIDPSNIPMPPLRKPGAAAPQAPAGGAIDLALRFDYDSDRLSAQDRATLAELAKAMRSPELAGLRFMIEGHTDSKGGAAYNERLSRLRAERVRTTLVASKIAAERLQALGKGSSEPADPARPEAPQNRRVRIISLGG